MTQFRGKEIKNTVRAAAHMLGMPVPRVRYAQASDAHLFSSKTQLAVADCVGFEIIINNALEDNNRQIVMAMFAALHETRHLWQYRRLCGDEQFADRDAWQAEFDFGALPGTMSKEQYNGRKIEVDAHAFAVCAMRILWGIQINVKDLPNSEQIEKRMLQILNEED